MDGKKQQATAPATESFFVDELFGPKDRRDESATSAAGYFSTVFPPPSAAIMAENASRGGGAHGGAGKAGQGSGSSSSSYSSGYGSGSGSGSGGGYATSGATGTTSESPYFGSSVHYGGRDFVYGATHGQQHSHNAPPPKTHKNNEDKLADGSAATRGDWWQGSLYY